MMALEAMPNCSPAHSRTYHDESAQATDSGLLRPPTTSCPPHDIWEPTLRLIVGTNEASTSRQCPTAASAPPKSSPTAGDDTSTQTQPNVSRDLQTSQAAHTHTTLVAQQHPQRKKYTSAQSPSPQPQTDRMHEHLTCVCPCTRLHGQRCSAMIQISVMRQHKSAPDPCPQPTPQQLPFVASRRRVVTTCCSRAPQQAAAV